LVSTQPATGSPATYEWDAEQRLAAVVSGNSRTEFSYDGLTRRVGIRKLISGSEVSNRRFVWCGDEICQERTAAGAVSKRFFSQGVKVETGPNTGSYYYTRDHLGSVRELTDSTGAVRARYSYDPFGRRTKTTGDLDAEFGFAGMFVASESGTSLTKFRGYDEALGRWLSRDPLYRAEILEGANLYAYVGNNPVNAIDPLGLQPVGPKAPPPPPGSPPSPCQPDYQALATCLLCLTEVGFAVKNQDPDSLMGGGNYCQGCLESPPQPCDDPPPPPSPDDCSQAALIEGIPPPCNPKPPCRASGS
jgi:RHS repeat-associated protein